MKLVTALFLLAVLTAAATSVAIAWWDGRIGHRDTMRAIHYDTSYAGQRQAPPTRL